jgi:hypothetical protein
MVFVIRSKLALTVEPSNVEVAAPWTRSRTKRGGLSCWGRTDRSLVNARQIAALLGLRRPYSEDLWRGIYRPRLLSAASREGPAVPASTSRLRLSEGGCGRSSHRVSS